MFLGFSICSRDFLYVLGIFYIETERGEEEGKLPYIYVYAHVGFYLRPFRHTRIMYEVMMYTMYRFRIFLFR